MQFKVKDIGEEGVDVTLPVTAAWLGQTMPELDAKVATGGLRFRGRLVPSGADYLLRGRLAGGLTAVCSRCLEPATVPLNEEITVIYTEEEAEKDEDEEDTTLDAPDVLTFQNGVIDVGEEIREEILLALPVSPLCKEDCAGLCPVCGGNRNANPCDCVEKQRLGESKFAALSKLKS